MSNTVTLLAWNQQIAKEYPFVVAHADGLTLLTSRAQVRRLSRELLEVRPSEQFGTDLVELWDKAGNRLRWTRGEDETIGDAVSSVATPGLAFITRYETNDPCESADLIIYKVGDFDVAGWLTERNELARIAVREAEYAEDRERTIKALGKLLAVTPGTELTGRISKTDGEPGLDIRGEGWLDEIAAPARGGAMDVAGHKVEVVGLYDVHYSTRLVSVDGVALCLVMTGRGSRFCRSVRPLVGGTYYDLKVSWIEPGTPQADPQFWLDQDGAL